MVGANDGTCDSGTFPRTIDLPDQSTSDGAAVVAAFREQSAQLEAAKRQIERHERQSRLLNDAALAMNAALSLEEAVQVITDRVRHIIGAHQAVTFFTRGRDWSQAIRGLSLSEKYAAFRTFDSRLNGSGIYALVCETNLPMHLTQSQLESHPRWGEFGPEALSHPPMRGWLAVPLIGIDGHNLGLIQLSDRDEGEFTQDDETILRQLGQMASVVLVTLRARDELEARVRERTADLTRANETLRKEISERMQMQEDLGRIAAELVRSNAELEQFAYVASHDLQEPLRMISSYVDLLVQRYQEQFDERATRWIAFAIDGVTRMRALINDLLEFARVGTRGKPPTATDCRKVFEAAVANLRRVIEESAAVIVCDPLPFVEGDANQLTQLLQNLIGNAIKYRRKASPHLQIAVQEQGDKWLFSVQDNGIGIESQFYERIFVIFQRLHTRQEYSGTGIGLALCKKIVERHGGRIWVESQIDQGSTFFFTISKVKEVRHGTAAPREASGDSAGGG